MTPTTQEFKVQGMSCNHCVRAVTEAVRQCDAQATVDVDLPGGRVTIVSAQDRNVLAQAIRDEGYQVS